MTSKPTTRRVMKGRRVSKIRRSEVRREEFNRLIERFNERAELLEVLQRNQEVQFKRIAQIQAELDQLKPK